MFRDRSRILPRTSKKLRIANPCIMSSFNELIHHKMKIVLTSEDNKIKLISIASKFFSAFDAETLPGFHITWTFQGVH